MRYSFYDFRDTFDKKSRMRGVDLYDLEAVTYTHCVNNTYYFEVQGSSDDYDTEITLDDSDEVKGCHCSCPYYASGHLCKHLYASLLTLDKVLDDVKADNNSVSFQQEGPLIIDAQFTPSTSANEEEKKTPSNAKTKLTNADMTLYKAFCNSSTASSVYLGQIVDKYNLSSENLASLFQMLRRPAPMAVFLSHFKDKIDADFVSKIDLTLFPASTSFKEVASFFIRNSNLLPYLSKESLALLFVRGKVTEQADRVTLFFLSLQYDRKDAINAFFSDENNHLGFFRDVIFIEYMKSRMTKEERLSYLSVPIRKATLTRMETAYLYPEFTDDIKTNLDLFFRNHRSALDKSIFYYSNSDYDNEYYLGLPINRDFYSLICRRSTNDMTQYDMRLLYYLRDTVFTGEDKLLFVKRFKQLATSMLRAKKHDYEKTYCFLSILLEYGDKIDGIKDVLEKVYETDYYKNNSANTMPEVMELYYQLKEKYSLGESIPVNEYKEEA